MDPGHFCTDPDGSSDPYLCLTDTDAGPGGPKTYGSGCRSGTLLKCHKSRKTVEIKFSYYSCLTMEGSGAGSVLVKTDSDPGGPKTYGS